MKLNTLIRFADGRIGTICFHHLIGDGGVWGEQVFTDIENLPAPQFLLRDPTLQEQLQGYVNSPVECVGEDYEIISVPDRNGRITRAYKAWEAAPSATTANELLAACLAATANE